MICARCKHETEYMGFDYEGKRVLKHWNDGYPSRRCKCGCPYPVGE